MPKIKTKSGAKKRFKVTGSGKVLYAQSRKRSRSDFAEPRARGDQSPISSEGDPSCLASNAV